MILLIAEKPSVAQKIARVLGEVESHESYLQVGEYLCSWVYGHLLGFSEPQYMQANWRRWAWESLPMLPQKWPLSLRQGCDAQLRVLQELMQRPEVRHLVCATDAGREGELIFRNLYSYVSCKKPVLRFWAASLTELGISRALAELKPWASYDNLAAAALGRAQADWLVGMNMSRAYTLRLGRLCAVGRVQTPTLAVVVEHDEKIKAHRPQRQEFLQLRWDGGVAFFIASREQALVYGEKGKSFSPVPSTVAEPQAGEVRVMAVWEVELSEKPPLFYDLGALQQEANSIYGWSGQRTLDLAQSLYEAGILSYPRTDCPYIGTSEADELLALVPDIKSPYELGLVWDGLASLSERYVRPQALTDHHGILPLQKPDWNKLSRDQARLFDLVCRRVLGAWLGDYCIIRRTSLLGVAGLYFLHQEDVLVAYGWRYLWLQERPVLAVDQDLQLQVGWEISSWRARVKRRLTKAPVPLTEGRLLACLQAEGLGTAATRAGIVEGLCKREYLQRRGTALQATAAGRDLVQNMQPELVRSGMTAKWESQLDEVSRGDLSAGVFIKGVEGEVRRLVGGCRLLKVE